MRILLDESLPRRLGAELAGHSVTTVQAADQNLQFQQNLSALPIPVIVLAAPTNKIEDLRPLVPELLLKLGSLAPGSYVRIGR
jgi:hypothetical protein